MNEKMEKIQAFALAAIILAFGFTGCLGDDTSNTKNEAPEAIILMPSQGSTVTAGEPFKLMAQCQQILKMELI